METEHELIAAMQADTALVKEALVRMNIAAGKLVRINHKAGRLDQSADAMIWHGAVMRLRGDLEAAHGVASKALVAGYGGEIVAAGPIR
jgi:hypothetical protein